MATIEVKGLKEAAKNMQELEAQAQKEIAREAAREFGWALAKPMRGATYTTFKRVTGAIQKGIAPAVQFEPKDNKLKAWVVEYPQNVAGAATLFKTLVRKHQARNKRKVALQYTAYWWRFLEFGTQPRRSARTPKTMSAKSLRPGTRSHRAWERFQKASNRGAIRARPWLGPAFGAHVQQAIGLYRETFLKLVDAAVSAMPKR